MSKLEYLLEVAYYLGKRDNEGVRFDIDLMDIEDFTTLCGSIVDDFYNQNEFAYVGEFLSTIDDMYLEEKAESLF